VVNCPYWNDFHYYFELLYLLATNCDSNYNNDIPWSKVMWCSKNNSIFVDNTIFLNVTFFNLLKLDSMTTELAV